MERGQRARGPVHESYNRRVGRFYIDLQCENVSSGASIFLI